jgi:hypothetical protein
MKPIMEFAAGVHKLSTQSSTSRQWRRCPKSATTETLPAVVENLWVILGLAKCKLAALDCKAVRPPPGPPENVWFIQSVSA